jgi:hypothetical protein
MSTIEIQLVFEGSAVQSGMIDARLLAGSLAGCSEIFRRANQIANGEASEAAVLVESEFKAGSFVAGLQLEQHVIETAKNLITHHEFLTATGLAALIGLIKKGESIGESLVDLWKWLKGKKPERVTQVGNNTEITVGTNRKTVNNFVYQFYGDPAIRAAFGQATDPLRQSAIDRISVKHNGEEQVAFEKEEARIFEAELLQLEGDAVPTEGERETSLIISKLAWDEKSTWTFFEQGGKVVAKIEDQEFWDKVHQRSVAFREGDSLRVRLRWEVIEKNHKLVQKNNILKVYQIMERPKQMRLDARQDNEVKPERTGRKFR